MSPKSRIIWMTTAVAALVIVVVSRWPQEGSGEMGVPVAGISHAHGLAVDISDSGRIYIATHHGLLVLTGDKKLFRVGDSQDDLMGFSIDPRDPRRFYRSGHPQGGGNSGFQVSEDGGSTWRTVSAGVEGPVDFHAMAVSPADPAVVYGWYKGVQRSLDGGRTWEIVNSDIVLRSLTADPRDRQVIHAASGESLLESRDQGATWLSVHPEVKGANFLAINPQDPQRMTVVTRNGLMVTSDAGQTWEKIGKQFGTESVFYMAHDPRVPSTIYALTNKNSVYRSTDDGRTWEKFF